MVEELVNATNAGLSEESAIIVAKLVADRVEEGEIYPTQALALAKWLELVAKEIKDNQQVADAAEAELTRNGGRLHQLGCEFGLKPSVRYDYSNSAAWNSIRGDMEPIEKVLKEVEAMAKKISTIALYTNPLTGEELEVKPALRRQTDSVTVKLPKRIEIEGGELPWD